MRKSRRIVGLATALAALGTPVAAPPTANTAESDTGPLAKEVRPGTQAETEIRLMDDGQLMSTVHRISNGLMFPQHGSHSSHSSHTSHASGSGGYGVPDYVPNLPSAPYVPYVPDPPYAPPPAAPPPTATTPPPTAPPATTADPKYVACNRANNGFGVRDIASELEQVFSMTENDAVDMAQQALTAVLSGGHYCDGYISDHG